MPGLEQVLLLCLAAAFAGWVDAVSGGGGLVQLPALLLVLPGASPAAVLATNKLSSVCGTAASALTYQRRVRPDLRTALPMATVALVGAAGGALCASALPRSVFEPLVLVLLVAVVIWTVARPQMGLVERLRFSGHRHHLVAAAAGGAIGFYDGIFGPGTGAFLVVALVGLLGYAFLPGVGHCPDRQPGHQHRCAAGVHPAGGADVGGSGSRWGPATWPAAGSGHTRPSAGGAASSGSSSSPSSSR